MTGLCHVAPLSLEKVTKMFALPVLKSFQETYIRPPKEGRRWVLVRQTRLTAVPRAAVVNARKMDPAIRIPRRAGLVAAQATAALTVKDPDREPFPACLVIENNRVAQGIVEGT